MSDIKIQRNSIRTVECDGKTYTCNGERIWVDGKLMYMFRDRFGLEQDIVVCSDLDPESVSDLQHIVSLPGHAPVFPDEPEPTGDRYLTFTANDDNVQLNFFVEKAPQFIPPLYTYDMWFSLDDGDTWEPYSINFDGDPQSIDLNSGESVMFKGVNNIGFVGEFYKVRFMCLGSISASGDITSILNGVGGDCELPEKCYMMMFLDCESLTTAPNLPSTTLANNCYNGMFSGCTSLIQAPELPATTLANNCYRGMFLGCTSLTTAPELPATELVSNCYGHYTSGHFSIDEGMFSGCTSLNYVKAMFLTKPGSEYTAHWLNNVSETGTFVKNSAATWNVTGVDGIPEGWTVLDYQG